MRLVIVVPTAPPVIVLRINHVFTRNYLRVAVRQQDNRAAIVTVGGPFQWVLRIDVSIKTSVRLAVRQHQHFGRRTHLTLRNFPNPSDVHIPAPDL